MITWKQDNAQGEQRELHYAFDERGWEFGAVIQFKNTITWCANVGSSNRRAISLDAAKAWVEAQFAQPSRQEVGNG